MKEYDHKAIEKKWQERWGKDGQYEASDTPAGADNEYVLVEFPYPSGNLHVGHWYAFAVPDIYVRFRRMQGKHVLFPIGFDAFGLPAENAAIKRGLNPREWTFDNIAYMRGQIKSMGASFDWSREVITADPSYYKWTQWLFLKLFEAGLVSRNKTLVNWCPSCKTVLANEQVVNGECERCDTVVAKREMEQWSVKITDYAERLLSDLETLGWPEEIKASQRNWIGKSEGTEFVFELSTGARVPVFTTRPDTLFGVTYLVLSPEHALLEELKEHSTNWDEVVRYIVQSQKKTEQERTAEGREKTGVELKGITATHPATGEEIPVWVADYVLSHVGTGAVMAVPAHDERDFVFAKSFALPIRQVVSGGEGEDAYVGEGALVNSGAFNGVSSKEARGAITKKYGKSKTTYRLRDWGVSRQRYWGCPIPLVHCKACGTVPVAEGDLPLVLPDIDDYAPREDGKSPLAKASEWVETTCPKCGGAAERETDTLDTFVDSAWYFLRYTDPHNDSEFAARDKQNVWMPVDFYSGGAEHTTMHLLYSRFFHKALFDLKLVADAEPYTKRMNRGLILGPDGNKMSKSRGNVIDPDDIVERLGADTVRTYLAFIGPYNEVGAYPWSPDGIVGVRRFLEKVHRMSGGVYENPDQEMEITIHQTIKRVTDALRSLKMNTGVAALMTFVNEASRRAYSQEQWKTFLKLLAPFAPHLAEELWQLEEIGGSIHTEPWPQYNERMLVAETVEIAVQISGKTRTTIDLAPDAGEEEAREAALLAAEKWVGDTEPRRVVYVPGKIINIVL